MPIQAYPPVWVINLIDWPDRRSTITEHLQSLNLKFEIVQAMDGRKLSGEELASLCDFEGARKFLGRALTAAEIGCSLSHLQLYRRLCDSDLDEVLILEDDVICQPGLLRILEQRDRLPKDWEILHFCLSDSRTSFWGRKPLIPGYECFRFASVAYNAGGYLIRRSAAEKMLRFGDPVRYLSDDLMGGAVRTNVRLYGIEPRCIDHRTGESTMPDANAQHLKWPKREEMNAFSWRLHRMKWGAIHFYQRLNPFCRV